MKLSSDAAVTWAQQTNREAFSPRTHTQKYKKEKEKKVFHYLSRETVALFALPAWMAVFTVNKNLFISLLLCSRRPSGG